MSRIWCVTTSIGHWLRQELGFNRAAARGANATMNWIVADQLLVSGTNFMTGVLLARALGVEAFGVFSLAWLVLLFMQSLQHAMVFSPMMSLGPKQRGGETAPYYAAVAMHQMALCVIFGVCVMLILPLERSLGLRWMQANVVVALAICVVVVQCYEFLRRYNFVIQRPRTVFLNDLLRNGLQLTTLTVWSIYGPRVGVAGVLLAIAVCSTMGILAFLRSAPPLLSDLRGVRMIVNRHVHFSKWLVGSALLQWTTANFIVVASGVLLGPVAVGALKASQTLVGVTHVFFQAADNVLPVHAARIYEVGGQQALRAFMMRLFLVGGSGTALVCLALAIPARQWLTLLFGQGYAEYSLVVVGFACAYFLLACTMPLRFAFLAMEKTRPIFIGYIFSTIFTLFAFYPLIQLFGIYGAVSGIAITEAIMLIVLLVHYRKNFGKHNKVRLAPEAEPLHDNQS